MEEYRTRNYSRRILAILAIIFLETALYNTAAKELPSTLSYKLDLKPDYANQKLAATCEMIISNDTDKPVTQIPVLLYRLLSVKSACDQDGNTLTFTQGVVSIKGWEQLQVNFIGISLVKILSPGEQMTLKLVYDGYIFGYSNEGFRYVRDHISRDFTIIRTDGFGYPLIGYPDDKNMFAITRERYDYLLDVTVPKDLVAACGGELMDVSNTGDETTYSFRSRKPSWRLDLAIAGYRAIEKNMNKAYCFREDSIGAESMVEAMEKSVDIYSGWFGNIRDYKGYTIIEVPSGYGSQADVTSFCMTADNFEAKVNTGIYHEISHLWNVKPLEVKPCRVESEGLAQFLQFLLSEQLDKQSGAVTGAAQKYLDDMRKTFNKNPAYLDIAVKDYGTADMTQYSYTLGMVFFALLYELSGQEDFNRAIGSFYSGYSEKGATLEDFTDCCIKYSGFDAERFFNDWIYSTNAIKLVARGASYQELKMKYR